jgi:sugar lactone lactonase YvrE
MGSLFHHARAEAGLRIALRTGSAAFALFLMAACGGGGGGGGGSTTTGTVPTTPVVTIANGSYVTTGQTGYAASVPSVSGVTYAWTATGATITAGATTDAVTFTPGAVSASPVTLSCVESNTAGSSTAGTATSTIVAAPDNTITAASTVFPSSTGNSASVPSQTSSTFAWGITGGTITAGGSTNAITFTAGASGTVALTCTVTNQAGTASALGSKSCTVGNQVISAPTAVNANSTGNVASVPSMTGATYLWSITGGTIPGSKTGNSVTFTAGASGNVVLNCQVTDVTVFNATAATVPIVAGPAAPSVTGLPTNVTTGTTGLVASVPTVAGVTYAWTVTNGTIASGQGTNQIHVSATGNGGTTLTCSCTESLSGVAGSPGSATSNIVAAPVLTSFTSTRSKVTAGYAAMLTAVYSGNNGTGVVTFDNGASSMNLASGSVAYTPAMTATGHMTLTVKNVAADTLGTVTSVLPITVSAVPTITAFTATNNSGTVTLADTTNASADGGTATVYSVSNWLSSFTSVATGAGGTDHPTLTTLYTLVNQNGAGDLLTAQAAVPITTSTGHLTTLAGNPSGVGALNGNGQNARFYDPRGMTMDPLGNLIVSEWDGATLRRVDPTGTVSMLAGTPGVHLPLIQDGYALPVPSQTPATFFGPYGVACDPAGNIFVADWANQALRVISSASGHWVVSTIDKTSLGEPVGVVVDKSGNLFVTDSGLGTGSHTPGVYKYTPGIATNGTVTWTKSSTAVVSNAFTQPAGIAIDGSGNLYVADQAAPAVYMLTKGSSGYTRSLVDNALTQPMGLAVTSDGSTLYVSDFGSDAVQAFTYASSAWSAPVEAVGSQNGISQPEGLVLSGTSLYVSDFGTHAIFKCDLTGNAASNATLFAGTYGSQSFDDGGVYPAHSPGNATFANPAGLAMDAAGNLFIADASTNSIRLYSAAADAVTHVAGDAGDASHNGNLGPVDDATGGANARFWGPQAVALDATLAAYTGGAGPVSGNVWVADTNNNAIRKIAVTWASGVLTTNSVTTVTYSNGTNPFSAPMGIAVSGTTIYVANNDNSFANIVKFSDAAFPTAVSTWATVGGSPGLRNLVVDGSGNIYVVGSDTNSILTVGSSGGTLTVLAGAGNGDGGYLDADGTNARFHGPSALCFVPGSTNDLYVADAYNYCVRKVADLSGTATVTTLVGSPVLFGYPLANFSTSSPQSNIPGSLATPEGIAALTGSPNSIYIAAPDCILIATP